MYLILSDYTSVFCSSFSLLHIIISSIHGKYAFGHIFILFFLPNSTHITIVVPCRGVKFLWQIMFWIDDDAAFSSSYLLFIFIIYILTGWKIKVTAKWGLDILRIHCQNSAFIMTNGIGNFRQGVDIFDKRILDSIVSFYPTVQFWIRPRLQQSFPWSWQSINRYHSGWCTTYQFHFPCFWQEGGGRKA